MKKSQDRSITTLGARGASALREYLIGPESMAIRIQENRPRAREQVGQGAAPDGEAGLARATEPSMH
eukprot:4199877-Pyramimonas_sp.AAC.1